MLKKIFFFSIVIISPFLLKSQGVYSIQTQGCSFDISLQLYKQKKSQKKWIEVKINIVNYDTCSKYFALPIQPDNDSSILFAFNEHFFKSNITEFYIGTCNEYRLPLYFCRCDSIIFSPLLPKSQIKYQYKVPVKWTSIMFNKTNQINFKIRFIPNIEEIRKKYNRTKFSLSEYMTISSLTIFELNKEKSRDAVTQ